MYSGSCETCPVYCNSVKLQQLLQEKELELELAATMIGTEGEEFDRAVELLEGNKAETIKIGARQIVAETLDELDFRIQRARAAVFSRCSNHYSE